MNKERERLLSITDIVILHLNASYIRLNTLLIYCRATGCWLYNNYVQRTLKSMMIINNKAGVNVRIALKLLTHFYYQYY